MKLIKIRPSKIQVPENRITSEMSEEKAELLRDYLKGDGQIAPVIVQEIEGEIWLVDGKHRIDELILQGDKEIDAAIIGGDKVDLITRNLLLDHVRGEHPLRDMVRVLKELYEDHGLDVVAIEEKTGLSRSYTEKLLRIGQAGPAVQLAIEEDQLGVGAAFEIARLPLEIQREEMVRTQQVFKAPVKELRAHIDEVLRMMADAPAEPEPVQPTGPPEPRVFACNACKNEGEFKDFKPVMLCPSCFSNVWRLGKEAEDQAAAAAKESRGG